MSLSNKNDSDRSPSNFEYLTALNWAAAFATFAIAGIGLWKLSQVLMLVFLALLWAVLLSKSAGYVQKRIPIGYTASLISLITIVVAALVAAFIIAAPEIVEEAAKFSKELSTMWGQAKTVASSWGLPISSLKQSAFSEAGGIADAVSGVLGALSQAPTATAVIIAVGFFFSLQPQRYQDILVSLFPSSKREYFRNTTDKVVGVLWSWLIGRAVAMLAVGLLAGIGLAFIGLPFALLLAVVAGFCNFVPTIGPIVGAAPALLVGAAQGGYTFIWTAGLYLVIQQIENNLITPFVQDSLLKIPPAGVILSQLIAGLLFGIVGVICAVPLMATFVVFAKEYYYPFIESK